MNFVDNESVMDIFIESIEGEPNQVIESQVESNLPFSEVGFEASRSTVGKEEDDHFDLEDDNMTNIYDDHNINSSWFR